MIKASAPNPTASAPRILDVPAILTRCRRRRRRSDRVEVPVVLSPCPPRHSRGAGGLIMLAIATALGGILISLAALA